jgi:hypothetical protein
MTTKEATTLSPPAAATETFRTGFAYRVLECVRHKLTQKPKPQFGQHPLTPM